MKTIVVPTDFSDYAWNALLTGLKLFAGQPARYVLLHAYEPSKENLLGFKSSVRSGTIYNALLADTTYKLEGLVQDIERLGVPMSNELETIAKPGRLEEVLPDVVKTYDADMIVMGTKGATGAKRVFLGSNTVRTLNQLYECPIMAVPKGYGLQALQKMVFPTDFTHFYKKNTLDFLLELVKTWSSKMLIFHVAQEFKLSDKQRSNKELLKKRLGTIEYSFHKVTIRTTVSNAIQEFAAAKGADMIALVQYKHTFLEKLTQEPVVKKVGFETMVPLLVLPE